MICKCPRLTDMTDRNIILVHMRTRAQDPLHKEKSVRSVRSVRNGHVGGTEAAA